MFRKNCRRCGRKVDKKYNFCPYCGYDIKRDYEEKNFGFLGRDDNIDFPDLDFGMRMPFGFNRIFSSLLKQIDKQFKELDKEIGRDIEKTKKFTKKPGIMSSGLSISISTGTGKKPEIKIRGFGPEFENLDRKIIAKEKPEKFKKFPKTEISEEIAKKIAKLPREEAETKVRRLSNKIIYEISLPGVKRIKDIIINQLENSIEIKAFSKEKVYFKLLPISLPIQNYKLQKGKLILELKQG